MYPILFSFGGIDVRTYTVMAVLAMFGAMLAVRSESRRLGFDVRATSWLTVQATLIGFAGSHVLYAITRLDLPRDEWLELLFVRVGYGQVWFGGFLASWAWVHFWARRRHIPVFRMYDVGAFAILVAQALGRIGCFFGGCCYGKPTELPWGVVLDTREGYSEALHPSPLYEVIYLSVVFAILWHLRTRNTRDGQTAVRYMLFASAGRFMLEFLRGDTIRGFVIGWLSTSQFIAIGVFAAGLVMRWLTSRSSSRTYPSAC